MYEISLTHYLILSSIIFTIGIFGVFLNRKNLIIILMSIELMLLAVNINFIAFSTHLDLILGQVFALFVLTVAAAEAAETWGSSRRGRRGAIGMEEHLAATGCE